MSLRLKDKQSKSGTPVLPLVEEESDFFDRTQLSEVDLLNDNYPNLFIVGAAFQALVFAVLYMMKDSIEVNDSTSEMLAAIPVAESE